MADSTAEVLFVETERFKGFCRAMRNVMDSVFTDVDAINGSLDEFGETWEGDMHDTFFLLFDDTKKDAANLKARFETVMEQFDQAAAAYAQLEEQLESLGTSRG